MIGLVIGIAFQDIAENFLESILISVQKPFRIGDLVRVEEHEGIVQRVTTRGTALLTSDGNHVQIPNSKMYKNTRKPQAKEQANSEAEGNMRSDTDDLQRQAADSWLPGEGEEILIGEE